MSNSTVQNLFSDRIQWLVEQHSNNNHSDFARKIGVSPPSVKRWIEQGQEPSRNVLTDISDKLNVDLVWLMTGKGSPEGADGYISQPAANDEDYKDVPIYDLAASAGTGRLVADEHITNYLKFPNWWFDERGLQHNSIAGLYTKGDSMEPTIPDNSLLLIDQSKTYLSDGKVYVIRADDELYVKRVKRIFGGGLELISDNVDYPIFKLTKRELEQDNFFQVIGQVVHIGIDLPH